MKSRVYAKHKEWLWTITILCFVLGMLLAAALKTQQNIRIQTQGIPTARVGGSGGLIQAFLDEKAANKVLRDRVTSLLEENHKYQDALGAGSTKSAFLGKKLQESNFLAGLTVVEGPGVEITLRDSGKKLPSNMDPTLVQEYLIHDVDLRNFVHELLADGAEVISIRDKDSNQRLIAKSSIRCVGGVIKVNGVPMSPPFTIIAIGPPNALESGMKMSGGFIETFRFIPGLANDMISVRKREHLEVPAYSGEPGYIYAREQKSGGQTN